MNAQQIAMPQASNKAEVQGFVGSWQVTFFEDNAPPTLALFTFTSDGTVIAAEHPVVTPPIADGPIFTSSGHGAWSLTGPDTAIVTFVGLGSQMDGALLGTATARSSITLGDDGRSFGGETVFAIADVSGNVLATFPGRFSAMRIVAEAPIAG